MDYSHLIEDYLASGNNSSKIEVSQLTNYNYTADVYYGDEEIENYLGSGSHIILSFSLIGTAPEDNAVGFEVTLESCTAPGVNVTQDGYYDITSGASMAFALLEEVARTAQKFLRTIRDGEIWISLN